MTTNKKLWVAVLFLLTVFSQSLQAKTWRINNRSNYDGAALWGDNFGGSAAYPVFKEVNQAVQFGIVNNGDTLQIEGSTSIYDDAILTKRLVLIGTGYFLTENPRTSNNNLVSSISRVTCDIGSQGSFLIGLNIVNAGNSFDGYVYVNVNDITVKRCRIERAVRFETLLSDIFILQNFFPSVLVTNCLATNGNSFFVPPTGIVFNNNICQKTFTWGTPLATPTTTWPILQCNNNVFDGPDNLAAPNLAFSTGDFHNNIVMPTNAVVNISAPAGALTHNIGTLSTQFGTTNNNVVVPGIATLFVTPGSTDGAYQVKDATQADNTGSDGSDRGAFGGAAASRRYTLSGLASIPVIYEITTSGVANASGLPVTIKARTIQ